jgi:hypothetical protein
VQVGSSSKGVYYYNIYSKAEYNKYIYKKDNVTGKRNAQASEMRTFAKTYLYT